MSQRQLQKRHVTGFVEGGKISLKESGEKIGVSCGWVKRIREVFKEKGIRGFIQGNTEISRGKSKKGRVIRN